MIGLRKKRLKRLKRLKRRGFSYLRRNVLKMKREKQRNNIN